MALPLIALPVIHSAGGYIATYAGSYVAGTYTATWFSTFVYANAVTIYTVVGGTLAAATIAKEITNTTN